MVKLKNHRPNPCKTPIQWARRNRNRSLSSAVRCVSKDKNPERVKSVIVRFENNGNRVDRLEKEERDMHNKKEERSEQMLQAIDDQLGATKYIGTTSVTREKVGGRVAQ